MPCDAVDFISKSEWSGVKWRGEETDRRNGDGKLIVDINIYFT